MNFYVTVALLFSVFAIALSYYFVKVKGGLAIKLALSTTLVLLATYLAFTYETILGFPAYVAPAAGSIVLAAFEKPGDDSHIYVWTIKPGDKAPRSHEVLNDQQNKEKHRAVRSALAQGKMVIIKKDDAKKRKTQSPLSSDVDLQYEMIDPRDELPPKGD